MLDRALTQKIAELIAGSDAVAQPLPGDLVALCEDARLRVVEYTRMQPQAALPPPEAVGRPEWIAANVASMASMLDSVSDQVGAQLGLLRKPAQAAAGALMSAEAGALTGYMSQRVLGQYELVL